MKLTGRQKLYLGILVVAMVGLFYDRLFILPQDAKAQAVDETAEFLVQTTGLSESVSEPDSEKTLSERLDELIPDDRLSDVDRRDIFTAGRGWSHSMTPDDTHAMSQTVIKTFQTRHKLRAIILTDTHTQVYVDDRVIGLGKSLDGFTLVAADETSATFAGQGLQIVLRLQQDK